MKQETARAQPEEGLKALFLILEAKRRTFMRLLRQPLPDGRRAEPLSAHRKCFPVWPDSVPQLQQEARRRRLPEPHTQRPLIKAGLALGPLMD